ncbi:MAG: hypothetical protein HY908_03355 [Myxococcales bacterium]|nr:hypothetical protein [Myxococcales bacterium]
MDKPHHDTPSAHAGKQPVAAPRLPADTLRMLDGTDPMGPALVPSDATPPMTAAVATGQGTPMDALGATTRPMHAEVPAPAVAAPPVVAPPVAPPAIAAERHYPKFILPDVDGVKARLLVDATLRRAVLRASGYDPGGELTPELIQALCSDASFVDALVRVAMGDELGRTPFVRKALPGARVASAAADAAAAPAAPPQEASAGAAEPPSGATSPASDEVVYEAFRALPSASHVDETAVVRLPGRSRAKIYALGLVAVFAAVVLVALALSRSGTGEATPRGTDTARLPPVTSSSRPGASAQAPIDVARPPGAPAPGGTGASSSAAAPSETHEPTPSAAPSSLHSTAPATTRSAPAATGSSLAAPPPPTPAASTAASAPSALPSSPSPSASPLPPPSATTSQVIPGFKPPF